VIDLQSTAVAPLPLPPVAAADAAHCRVSIFKDALRFLERHLDCDGRGVVVAIFDTGAHPSAYLHYLYESAC
jgi:hypothetical protein